MHQAVFGLRGVTDNVHGITLNQLKDKEIFRNLIKVLGCGCGSDFNLPNLRFDKIIICTDMDVDGSNITSLLLCFFLQFMPQLFEAGKIYKAMPPLYQLDPTSYKKLTKNNKGDNWLYDKKDYYALISSLIANNVNICIEPASGKKGEVIKLSKSGAAKWLTDNAEYDLELDTLSKKAACDATILENVCYCKVMSKGNEEKFKTLILKIYPEMTYDVYNHALIGSVDGEFFSLICDSIFEKNAQRFIVQMANNPSIYVHVKNASESDDTYQRTTIGSFLVSAKKSYAIKIEQRFKGLGEAEPDVLFVTTTNPKIRRLLRMTIKDAKKAKETFAMIHGRGEQMINARRKFLSNLPISYADIDN